MNMAKSRLSVLFLIVAAIAQGTKVWADESAVLAQERAGAAEMRDTPIWYLRLPENGKVAFRGIVNFDNAGADGKAVIYPAPNAVGLLVAIAIHAAQVEASKNRQRENIINAADKVLQPYQTVLDGYAYAELMQSGAGKMALVGSKRLLAPTQATVADGWLIESALVFSLTQDQRAIVLENAIVVQTPGNTTKAAGYKNVVKVVSHAIVDDDPVSYWTANEGERLKQESASLLAESLDAALDDMLKASSAVGAPYKTVRYHEGSVKKTERAQVLGGYCHRITMRTLRGNLMIVPAEAEKTGETPAKDCYREPFSVVAQW
jgi:hypothetical protein